MHCIARSGSSCDPLALSAPSVLPCFSRTTRVGLVLPDQTRCHILTQHRLLARLSFASRLIPASTPITWISELSFGARWWLWISTAPADQLVSPTYVHALLLEAWFPARLTAGNLFCFLCLTAAYITQQIISDFHAQLILQHLLPTWSVRNLPQNMCPSFASSTHCSFTLYTISQHNFHRSSNLAFSNHTAGFLGKHHHSQQVFIHFHTLTQTPMFSGKT
jgi:hypothetical protein